MFILQGYYVIVFLKKKNSGWYYCQIKLVNSRTLQFDSKFRMLPALLGIANKNAYWSYHDTVLETK